MADKIEDFKVPVNGNEVTVQRNSETGEWHIPAGVSYFLTPATLEGIRLQRESSTSSKSNDTTIQDDASEADSAPADVPEDTPTEEAPKPKRRAPKKDS